MRPQPRRALVIGGSISGLFSALYLRRRGWEVDVYERSPAALTGRGAGIMTHPELRHALAELGRAQGGLLPGRTGSDHRQIVGSLGHISLSHRLYRL